MPEGVEAKMGSRERLRREANATRQALGMPLVGDLLPIPSQPAVPVVVGEPESSLPGAPPAQPPPSDTPSPLEPAALGDGNPPAGTPPGDAPPPPPGPTAVDTAAASLDGEELTWKDRYSELRRITGPIQQENAEFRRDLIAASDEAARLRARIVELDGQVKAAQAAQLPPGSSPEEKRKALRSLYPEVADELEALEGQLAALQGAGAVPPAAPMPPTPESAPPAKPIDPIEAVLAAHPDAKDVVGLDRAGQPTAKSAAFWNWVESQPVDQRREMHALARSTRAYAPQLTIQMLDRFKESSRTPAAAPAPTAPPPPSAPPRPTDLSLPRGAAAPPNPDSGEVKPTIADLNDYRKNLHRLPTAEKEKKRAWFKRHGLM